MDKGMRDDEKVTLLLDFARYASDEFEDADNIRKAQKNSPKVFVKLVRDFCRYEDIKGEISDQDL